jgi:outer membrane receptor for ferrienterochelin and colicins
MREADMSGRWGVVVALGVLLMLLPGADQEAAETPIEEMSLEELLRVKIPTVTTASTLEQSIENVPGTVTVITAEQIKGYGLRYLIDVFNIVPGFQTFTTSYASTDVRVRKFSAFYSTLKVMIDGRPVNEIYHRQLHVYEYFPLGNVKQIEIIRGPGSALYGTDAFCGVVNVITDDSERTTVSGTGGEHSHYGANLAHYGKVGDYSFTADYFDGAGDDLFFGSDFLTGTGMSYAPNTRDASKNRLGISATLQYKGFQLTARHADNEREWWEGYVNIQSPGEEVVRSKLTYVDLQYLHSFSNETSLRARGMYDRNTTHYVGQLFPPGFDWGVIYGVPDINGDGIDDNWPDGAPYDSKLVAQNFVVDLLLQLSHGRHRVSAGAEYGTRASATCARSRTSTIPTSFESRTTPTPGTTQYSAPPAVFMVGEGESEDHLAVFLQDVINVHDRLSVTAGARHDDYQDAGGRSCRGWHSFGKLYLIMTSS